jgi:ketosteroid isomerase-like protein
MRRWVPFLMLYAFAGLLHAETNAELKEQIRKVETSFAKTMADRDATAFASFLSEETVFMTNGQATRGANKVAERWKPYFVGPQAPFSWESEFVEVLESGNLALSTGPVYDTAGKRFGTFNSIWRREAGGAWKIVFDSSCPACNCGTDR